MIDCRVTGVVCTRYLFHDRYIHTSTHLHSTDYNPLCVFIYIYIYMYGEKLQRGCHAYCIIFMYLFIRITFGFWKNVNN